jgi:hypothetical protein
VLSGLPLQKAPQLLLTIRLTCLAHTQLTIGTLPETTQHRDSCVKVLLHQ